MAITIQTRTHTELRGLRNCQRRDPAVHQVDEPAVERDFAMPEKAGQHCQGMIRKRLIDEGLLPFQCLDSATGRQIVRIIQMRSDDLGKQFSNGWKSAARFSIAVVFRLPEHKLSTIGGVAEIQPVNTFFKET
jgi:hypothetical protein